jgi:hypothetical protein
VYTLRLLSKFKLHTYIMLVGRGGRIKK